MKTIVKIGYSEFLYEGPVNEILGLLALVPVEETGDYSARVYIRKKDRDAVTISKIDDTKFQDNDAVAAEVKMLTEKMGSQASKIWNLEKKLKELGVENAN